MGRAPAVALALACGVAAVAGACGNSGDSQSKFNDGGAAGAEPGGTPGAAGQPGGSPGGFGEPGGGDASALEIAVAPADAVVEVDPAQPLPTTDFKAFVGGTAVNATWTLDRGELGAIGETTGKFTPNGSLGGTARVTASYRGKQGATKVTVRLKVTQNGAPPLGDAGTGSGGNGGVGGEGPGGAVNAAKLAVLRGAPQALAGLDWLYPYEGTVWPRGILAPLLQWSLPGGQDFDAVWIHVEEGAFAYDGYFGKPAGAARFARHPIPQAAWRQLAYSNGGEDVSVRLTFALGTTAYGPITQKWKVAQGTLKGTVYYNSYGTALARNHSGGMGGFSRFGGATLGIRGASTDPVLVAGADSADETGCRVCHSVAGNGSRLVTQHGEAYGTSSAYTLGATVAQTQMPAVDGRFGWPALFPDGTMLFSNASPLIGGWDQPSKLYAVPGGAEVPTTGIPAGLKAATPVFSNDGRRVAFNFRAGQGADGRSLGVMDFDPTTKAFSNLQVLFTPPAGMVVWPTFMPASDAVVFELETVNNGRDFAGTRSTCDSGGACSDSGARAELWWVHVPTKQAKRLDKANGLGHVPRGGNAHDVDETLNYEPTVSPVPSGGYAWMVFTSRRLYGNVATMNPFWSDPRFHDISVDPTPKKLWVAAIDLAGQPGTDPSHPAFYLPAQELLAGNSRGYWVVDPCRANGTSCETGDECCGGFCRAAGDGGALVCSDQKPVCAQEFERCAVDADCCPVPGGSLRCVNGRCARPDPR